MSSLTIGMPVYNDVLFIEQSLKSILAQSYVDFILFISDDGSTDGSEAICKKYEQLDSRVKYYRQPKNLGISKNMEFLLAQAKSKYFMWAGDDDLWDTDFARELISLLENDEKSISAFCNFQEIDEVGRELRANCISINYREINAYKRIKNFIKNADDRFGYGIFRTDAIKEVKFPVWWWPNKKTPYNNIFPTLCYYLSQGNFAFYDKKVLFFKREKTDLTLNYSYAGKGNGLAETFAYIIRRFNLITFSTKLIRRSSGGFLAFRIYFVLFYHWFVKSSCSQLKLLFLAFFRRLRTSKDE